LSSIGDAFLIVAIALGGVLMGAAVVASVINS
jgi:hypothetical protein